MQVTVYAYSHFESEVIRIWRHLACFNDNWSYNSISSSRIMTATLEWEGLATLDYYSDCISITTSRGLCSYEHQLLSVDYILFMYI